MAVSCLLCWPFPCSVDLVDWHLESLKLLWVRDRQRGLSLHILISTLCSSILFFSPLLSTILLPPYKIFQPALNYWPVWSPVRLHHCWDVVHQQQHSFLFFFWIPGPEWKHGQILSEVSGAVTFHYYRIQIQTVGRKKSMNKYILSEWIVALSMAEYYATFK